MTPQRASQQPPSRPRFEVRTSKVARTVMAWHAIVFLLPLTLIWVTAFITGGSHLRDLRSITEFTAILGLFYYLPYVLISAALTGLLILGYALAARTARRGPSAGRTTMPPSPGAPQRKTRPRITPHDIDLGFVASVGGVLITLCLVILGLRVW